MNVGREAAGRVFKHKLRGPVRDRCRSQLEILNVTDGPRGWTQKMELPHRQIWAGQSCACMTKYHYTSTHSVHTCLDDVAGAPNGLQVHLRGTCTACTATAAAATAAGGCSWRGHQVCGKLEQRALGPAARAFAAAGAAAAASGGYRCSARNVREAACRCRRVEQYIGQEVFLQVWMHIGGGGIKGKTCPKGWALMGRESKEV